MKELDNLLARFSAPEVPAMGPDEIPAEPPYINFIFHTVFLPFTCHTTPDLLIG